MEFNDIDAFSRARLFHNMGVYCIHLFLRHSGRTMALGSTLPLIEMSTRNISLG
jgi:hypothetical protein